MNHPRALLALAAVALLASGECLVVYHSDDDHDPDHHNDPLVADDGAAASWSLRAVHLVDAPGGPVLEYASLDGPREPQELLEGLRRALLVAPPPGFAREDAAAPLDVLAIGPSSIVAARR